MSQLTRIGRYIDLQLLGRGGMGAVYRGRDPDLDRLVAIKVMLHASPDFVARFRREAQAIAKLQHPNIVNVYDFGVDEEENPYFVMELVDGRSLDRVLAEEGRLPPLVAVKLIRQAAEGLAVAHKQGIIHRDVKPANLIVLADQKVKIVDFGIARITQGNAQLTGAASLMGTPGYMAPEQATGGKVDQRADIYALGMTLFELLAGRPPYIADDVLRLVMMNLNDPLPDLRTMDLGLPEEIVSLVEQMAHKDPELRLQSCEAVVAALDDLHTFIRTSGEREVARPTVPKAPKLAMGMPTPDTPMAVPVPTPNPPPDAADTKAKSGGVPLGAIAAALLVLVVGGGAVAYRSGAFGPAPTSETPKPIDNAVPPKPVDNAVPPKPADNAVPPKPAAAATPLERPLRTAILKFKNVGRVETLVALEQGIGETVMSTPLGSDVKLFERYDIESEIGELDRIKDEHFDKLTVAQSGNLAGVQVVAQGAFQETGGKLRITARIVRVETGEVLDTVTVTGDSKAQLKLQDDIAAQLGKKLAALAKGLPEAKK